jgi:hypothetical protein
VLSRNQLSDEPLVDEAEGHTYSSVGWLPGVALLNR